MHPAYSVILFTTASGAGYGLLVLLCLLVIINHVSADPILGLIINAVAFILVTCGLLASTFHLGHPERAWRALSQWRSSWLSREGIAAIATYIPWGLLAICWLFLDRQPAGIAVILAALTAALAGVTVYCTGMIYASLAAIPRWHNRWTVPNYLLLGLMTGAWWLNFLLHALGDGRLSLHIIAFLTTAAAWLLKRQYWSAIDRDPGRMTIAQATGLGHLGPVRLLDAPHTGSNYLLQEMGYHVARKHAVKLRVIAQILGFAAPIILGLLASMLPITQAVILLLLAALCAVAGTAVERWLFFAEAEHAVTLYYGADKV